MKLPLDSVCEKNFWDIDTEGYSISTLMAMMTMVMVVMQNLGCWHQQVAGSILTIDRPTNYDCCRKWLSLLLLLLLSLAYCRIAVVVVVVIEVYVQHDDDDDSNCDFEVVVVVTVDEDKQLLKVSSYDYSMMMQPWCYCGCLCDCTYSQLVELELVEETGW